MPRLLLLTLLLCAGCSGSQMPVGTPSGSDESPTSAMGAPPEASQPSQGSPTQLDTPEASGVGLNRHVVAHDGIERVGSVYVPALDDRAKPLVILLHGLGSTSDSFTNERSGFLREAQRRGWIVSIPNGTPCHDRPGNCWNARDEPEAIAFSLADDEGYLRAVLADLVATLPVNASRVYLVGHSNGASMVHRIAAVAPDRFAAGVTINGLVGRYDSDRLDRDYLLPPTPSAPFSLLSIRGYRDSTFAFLPAQHRGGILPAFDGLGAFYHWAYGANTCTPGDVEHDNLSPTFLAHMPGGRGQMQAQGGLCAPNTLVRIVVLLEHGHGWPTAADKLDADTAVFAFFDEVEALR